MLILFNVSFIVGLICVCNANNFSTTMATEVNTTAMENQCWLNENDKCLITASCTRPEINHEFPVHYDCSVDANIEYDKVNKERYRNISEISLNGCTVNRHNITGAEYIIDPKNVKKLTIEMFRITKIEHSSFIKCIKLKNLILQSNIIPNLNNVTFIGLAELTNLSLVHNNIQHIDDDTFTHLMQLQTLTIQEKELLIQQSIQLPINITNITIKIKSFEWPKFPESLKHLSVYRTSIFINKTEPIFTDMYQMEELHIIGCSLMKYPKIESNTMITLNFSDNNFENFNENIGINLINYDVSKNLLKHVSNTLLRSMRNLKQFFAVDNQIEKIDNNAFINNSVLKVVNLSKNRLRQVYINLPAQQTISMYVNDNPWSCKWIKDISESQPHLFSSFHYEKYVNAINVNGLKCIFYDGDEIHNYKQLSTPQSPPDNFETTTKRNPRDTAILTLVMLVLGVAVLFLLLFLHIKCRRNTQQPFYRTLPYNSQRLIDRTDYVRRQLPATDYEDPILCRSGSVSGHINPFNRVAPTKTISSGTDIYEEIPDRHANDSSDEPRHISEHFIAMNSLYVNNNEESV